MKDAKELRTAEETVGYFEQLADHFEKLAEREENALARERWIGKAEAYELAAFEVKENMAPYEHECRCKCSSGNDPDCAC